MKLASEPTDFRSLTGFSGTGTRAWQLLQNGFGAQLLTFDMLMASNISVLLIHDKTFIAQTKEKTMRQNRGIHWQVPTAATLPLLAGALFAFGHHLFYSSLDGKPAPDDHYSILGSYVSTQQLNTAAGTAFAFLVKACLFMALSAAYAQIFWRQMLHITPEVTLERLDATYAALTNIHHLFKVWIWYRYPLLFLLALIGWLMPIAAIVTPATLSIKSAPVVPPLSRMQHVPNVDFVNLNYVGNMAPNPFWPDTKGPNEPVPFFYNGPSRAVENVVQAVAAEGSMLPISSPGINSSYHTEFYGPAVRCHDVSETLRAAIEASIVRATRPHNTSCHAYGFLAWTPEDSNQSGSGLLPFTNHRNKSYSLNSVPLSARHHSSPASIYLAAMPEMMVTQSFGDHGVLQTCQGLLDNESGREYAFNNSAMLQCDLHNTTYSAEVKFINGDQHIAVTPAFSNDAAMNTVHQVYGPPSYPIGRASGPDCSPLTLNSERTCTFNSSLISILAYQAVFQAFTELLVGSIFVSETDFNPAIDTAVQDTTLVDSPELSFLTKATTISSWTGQFSLQQSIMSSNGTLFEGIWKNQSSSTSVPLRNMMEQLFQNVTISLMSSRKLQPDLTSEFAPAPVNVTFHTYHNIYVYSAYKLWIAYGLAIFFTTICSTIGLAAIVRSRASYSLGFSTVFRASKTAYTMGEFGTEDVDIQDPLPDHLTKAKIWFAKSAEDSDPNGWRVSHGDSQTDASGRSSRTSRQDMAAVVLRTSITKYGYVFRQ